MKPAGTYTDIPPEILSVLLDKTREVFLLINRKLEVVLYNSKANESSLQQLNRELYPGLPVLELAENDKREWMKMLYEEVLANGREKIIRYPLRNVTFRIALIPVHLNGIVEYILVSVDNVTYEEEALEHIRNKQFLMQQAEQIAGFGSWEWNIPDGTVLFSDEFYRILDLEPNEKPATRELGFSFVHPDDVERAESTLQNTLDTGEPYETELRLITNAGNLKNVLCKGGVTRDNNGRLSKLIGTFLDITAKKQMERSIHNQNLRFRALVEKSSDLIIQVGSNMVITYCSPAAEGMLGMDPAEITGKKIDTLAWPQDLGRLQEELSSLLGEPEKLIVTEYRCNKKDGSYLWVEATISNHLGVQGIESIVINHRDIHQKKEVQEMMKELNQELESRARALSLSNTELERFAYVASHDLQEPLRMVSSFLGLLKRKYQGILDDKGRQYIDMAVDGSERMKLLINDLLEYSRVGREREQPGLVNLNEIIDQVKETYSRLIQETGAVIEHSPIPVIRARKTHMSQLLQNLVGNALKYRSEGAPVIKISSTITGNCQQVIVEDNGIGIPEKYASEVFNIFHRLHGRSDYEGTGIGLAICKKIVEVYNGSISVSPAEGRGSRFIITLPVHKQEINA